MSETEGAVETPQAAEAPAGPDFSPINSRIDELGAQMQDFMSTVNERLPAAAEPEQDPEFDFSEYDTTDPAQAQQALAAFVQQQVQQGQQQALAPITAELQQFRAEQQHQQLLALEQTYPQMQDPEYASQLIGQAAELAQGLPSEIADQMVRSPQLLEALHFAQMGRERAAGETPAGGQVSAGGLEDAAGGTPGGAEPTSLADQIRASRGPRNSVFGFETGA